MFFLDFTPGFNTIQKGRKTFKMCNFSLKFLKIKVYHISIKFRNIYENSQIFKFLNFIYRSLSLFEILRLLCTIFDPRVKFRKKILKIF